MAICKKKKKKSVILQMTDTSIHWAIYNRQNKVIIKINIHQFKVSDTGFMTADASEIWENNVTC